MLTYVGTAGECKSVMQSYLGCMKKKRGMNDPECRDIAKAYLTCRMDRCAKHLALWWIFTNGRYNDRNLMAKDEFKNLGFADNKSIDEPRKDSGPDKGTKGELTW
jgi:cytochrome c oxidase assembly protein subunit 19